VLPGRSGELGIYRAYPLITRIKPGAVRIQPAAREEHWSSWRWHLEVTEGDYRARDTAFAARISTSEGHRGSQTAQEARKTAQGAQALATAEASLAVAAAQIAAIRSCGGKKPIG